MISAKYNWHVNKLTISPEINALADELKITPILTAILWQRGMKTAKEITTFLNPSPENLRDPFLIHDMRKAIDRISDAISKGERITIYGDYDADGITSTSILYETLLEIGADVNYYIPNRFKDGYGPNSSVFQKLIEEGTKLIITVDNGIVGNEAVDVANKLGCDVIITDHHNLPPNLPNAFAIVHARFPGDEYPFGDFSGAGVAFKVACALTDDIPQEVLDLVTIGTVADMVSLTDENRVIAKFGFEALKLTQRPGLANLIKNAGLDGKEIGEHQISFQIAPRLNALGRMGDANVGVELLTTLDPEKGKELADLTENKNKERQQLVSEITKEAVEQAESPKNKKRHTLVIYSNDWHEGVLGIVASRLVDRYHKPTLVLTKQDSSDSYKGSGRSISGFNLFASLDSIRNDLAKFGGHEMAVGLTVAKNKIELLEDSLDDFYNHHYSEKSEKAILDITSVLPIEEINLNLYDDIRKMAPFGTDNDEPIFEIHPNHISNIMVMGNNKQHLKFMANSVNGRVSVVAFKKGELINDLRNVGIKVAVAGKIDLNEWQGHKNLQLLLDDIKTDGVSLIDNRSNHLTKSMFNNNYYYLFFDSTLAKKLKPYISDSSKIIIANNIDEPLKLDKVTIVDCPLTENQFTNVINNLKTQELKFYFYYQPGQFKMPNRNDFVTVFNFIKENEHFNLRESFVKLQEHLQLPKNLIIFILQVFDELDFIDIQNGIVSINPNPTKQSLQSASIYQKRLQKVNINKILLGNQQNLFNFIYKCLNK